MLNMEYMVTIASIKQLLYLLLVTCVAFIIHFTSINPQSYWVVITALMLAMINVGNSFGRRVGTIALTGLGIIITSFIANLLASFFPFTALYLFLLTTGCVFLTQYYPRYFFPLFIVNLFTIIAAMLPTGMADSVIRLIYITAGCSVALLLQSIFWPHFVRNELRSLIIMTLSNLNILNKKIFACFLQPDYPQNLYLYERRMHAQKNRHMQLMNQLRAIVQSVESKIKAEEKDILNTIINKLDLLYEIMLDSSQLRRRVSDHTTFGLCSNELSALSQAMDNIFSELKALFAHKNPLMDTTLFGEKIKHFDETYQHVLQVAAPEPLVFLLFIASMRAFYEEITQFFHDALKVRILLG